MLYFLCLFLNREWVFPPTPQILFFTPGIARPVASAAQRALRAAAAARALTAPPFAHVSEHDQANDQRDRAEYNDITPVLL